MIIHSDPRDGEINRTLKNRSLLNNIREKEQHVPEVKCTSAQVFRQAGNHKERINDKSSRMID